MLWCLILLVGEGFKSFIFIVASLYINASIIFPRIIIRQ